MLYLVAGGVYFIKEKLLSLSLLLLVQASQNSQQQYITIALTSMNNIKLLSNKFINIKYF